MFCTARARPTEETEGTEETGEDRTKPDKTGGYWRRLGDWGRLGPPKTLTKGYSEMCIDPFCAIWSGFLMATDFIYFWPS